MPLHIGDDQIDELASALHEIRGLLKRELFAHAEDAAQLLTAKVPRSAEARLMLGVAQAEQRKFDEAESNIRSAISASVDNPWQWRLVLANVLRDAGHLQKAVAEVTSELHRHPNLPLLHNALGLIRLEEKKPADALDCFRAAYSADTSYAAAYLNAAIALQTVGRIADALDEIKLGLAALPDRADLTLAFAKLLDQQGQAADAKTHYERVIQLDAAMQGDVYARLGWLAYRSVDLLGAIAAYEQAIGLGKTEAEIWNVLGNCYLDIAGLDRATRSFENALQIEPLRPEIYDNLLMSYHYNPKIDPETMYEAHRGWAHQFAAPRNKWLVSTRRTGGVGKIRLGFLSSNFDRAPVRFFLLPLLRNIDGSRYEIFCYEGRSSVSGADKEIRALSDHWLEGGAHDDERLAEKIHEDKLHVLVDLDGHTPGNRLRAISYKPAPTIASWLDYFDTTGVGAVDFLVGDSITIPKSTPQRFSEKIVRLDPSRLCYAPPSYAPAVAPPAALRNRFVTFGSFNRLSKISESVVDLWSRLLQAIPNSGLLLKSPAFSSAQTCALFAERFRRRGIGTERLELRPASAHAEMLAEYGDVDIALDPFPYNGGLTTCEALWMGVPVVARLGASMISRQTASLLGAANCEEWIAQDDDEWCRMNCNLASSSDGLRRLRESLRARVGKSLLMDGRAFAHKFDGLIRKMVS